MSAIKPIKTSNSLKEQRSELLHSVKSMFGRICLAAIAAILICQSTGCTVNPAFRGLLDEPIIDYRDMVWARRAYNMRYGHCDRDFENHFQNGFLEGYCNVCEGGNGYVPAMPPEEYWGYEYQSAEGSQCVNSWFEAFPLGAAAARKDGAGAFHDVYISKMVNSAVDQEKAIQAQPEDVPIRRSTPEIAPDLRIDAPPKPIATPLGAFESSYVPRGTMKIGQLTPIRIPVDPSVNAPMPVGIRSTFPSTGSVQTAAGFESTLLR